MTQHHITARGRDSAQKSARLDAVGHDLVLATVQALHTLDADAARAMAFDLRAHFDEHLGQVGNLGLLGGVFQHRLAFGQGRGHHEVFSAGDGDHVGGDARAFQARAALRQAGQHVAMVHRDDRTHGLQTFDVLVDRARANGATTWQRHFGVAKTGQQRPQRQHRSAHGFHQLVRRFRVVQASGVQRDPTVFVVLGRHAHVADQLEHGRDVLQARHIGQRDGLGAQQSGAQLGQGRIFGTRHIERALQAVAAANFQFVHGSGRCVAARGPSVHCACLAHSAGV